MQGSSNGCLRTLESPGSCPSGHRLLYVEDVNTKYVLAFLIATIGTGLGYWFTIGHDLTYDAESDTNGSHILSHTEDFSLQGRLIITGIFGVFGGLAGIALTFATHRWIPIALPIILAALFTAPSLAYEGNFLNVAILKLPERYMADIP